MARRIETPGEVLFEHSYDTVGYKVYTYESSGKRFKIYLPIDRARGLQGFKAIVAVSDAVSTPDNNQEPYRAVANSMHNQVVEQLLNRQVAELRELNNKFAELIEAVRVAPNNPANEKPKCKYTRRKTTKRSVKRAS